MLLLLGCYNIYKLFSCLAWFSFGFRDFFFWRGGVFACVFVFEFFQSNFGDLNQMGHYWKETTVSQRAEEELTNRARPAEPGRWGTFSQWLI